MKECRRAIVTLTIAVFAVFALFAVTNVPWRASESAYTAAIFGGTAKRAQGLGALCSGEAECTKFCSQNRGRCETACTGTHSQLCARLFSPARPDKNREQIVRPRCVSNPSPVFIAPFADHTKINDVSQYGNNALVNPGAQIRSYIRVKKGELTPIYAPRDATITKLSYANRKYPELTRPEYRIDIEVSCEVQIGFDHILTLAPKFVQEAPSIPAGKTKSDREVSIPIRAGEVLGYTPGTYVQGGGGSFDFFFTNTARPAARLNPPMRWTSEHSKYYGCMYDYFTAALKQQYYGLMEEERGVRSCGPRVREIPQTAAGYWFQGNATESSGSRFVIYANKHFAEWTLIKDAFPLTAYRTSDADFIAPELVTEGKSACYFDRTRNSHVYLAMLPKDTLKMSAGTGSCPASFPEAQAEVWER